MCTSPLVRYRLKVAVSPDTTVGVSARFQIKSLKQLQTYFKSYSAFRNYFDTNMDYQYLKCRKCDECKMEYARDWSVRCANELEMRGKASFITLTIDDTKVKEFMNPVSLKKYCKRCVNGNRYIRYPINYTLCKHMLMDELKRMRDKLYKRYGIKIRYFGCGEYGSSENTERPHYHILIFGYDFPDRHFIEMSKKGIPIYFSEELQEFWKYGLAKVQEVNHRACMYTAKYCLKKMKFTDDLVADEYYHGREPEFLVMSKGNCQSNRCPYIDDIVKNCKGLNSLRNMQNPYCKNCDKTRGGIGYDWFLKYHENILKIGYITIDGVKYPIPKYYLQILKLTYPDKYDKYKISVLDRADELEKKFPHLKDQNYLNIKKKSIKERLKHTSRQ